MGLPFSKELLTRSHWAEGRSEDLAQQTLLASLDPRRRQRLVARMRIDVVRR